MSIRRTRYPCQRHKPIELLPFYGEIGVRNALYHRRLLQTRRLEGAVVSVGNLSAGGSARPLSSCFWDICSKREELSSMCSLAVMVAKRAAFSWWIPPGCRRILATNLCLLRRKLQAPVIVGEDRFRRLARQRPDSGRSFICWMTASSIAD